MSSPKSRQFKSVESWEKVVRDAPWVGGQASHLNPGSSAAVSRRRNSGRYRARGKKVIRPRIRKHRSPDKDSKGRDT
jgi:hypothetical protein